MIRVAYATLNITLYIIIIVAHTTMKLVLEYGKKRRSIRLKLYWIME